jgi:hypothetical protein
MARASIEPMITTKTASNAVFSASERLLPSFTIIRVAMKTITPRTETCRNAANRCGNSDVGITAAYHLNLAHAIHPMKDLDSYLNDHLAGSVSALELIAHSADVHTGESLGSFFRKTEREIKGDQATLRDVMRTLGVEESKVRQAGAWAAEKVGRARLIIAGDEPDGLGLVLTLEGLIMGVTGKKLMWRTLAAANLPQLNGYNFEELQRGAEQQIQEIEAERIRAVSQAFAAAIRSK